MSGLTGIEIIYWASTIIGGTLFILRLITMFMGGGLSDDGLDSVLDTGGDVTSGDQAEADASFNLLSLQGLTSFFMMFGLVGLALLKAELPILLTVFGGMIAGLITVAISGLIFSQMLTLYLTPIVYIYMARFTNRLTRKRAAAPAMTEAQA